MIVVASRNGIVGIRQAMQILKNGGSAVDAVEAGIRPVEDNPQDHSVGYSGYPSILGELELDASIMNGRDLTAGAVGCVKGFPNPISIARRVMETLPHVFLVGPGAERFAAEMGFQRKDMQDPGARQGWLEKLAEIAPGLSPDDLADYPDLAGLVREASDPNRIKGTVNFIAMDNRGDICTGVSTSGWYYKYPGRLGDSPVIGAGNYADNRYGAAACTGMGEMALRASTAHSVVFYMKMGMSVEEAGVRAMKDLVDLGGPYISDMNIIALDRNGTPAAFTSTTGGKGYIYMTEDTAEPVLTPRTYVDIPERWGDADKPFIGS